MDKAFTMAVYNPEKEKLPKGYTDQTTEGYGRMVYPQAFGEHTYIEYINTNTGVKENIVLEENTGRNRFDFVFASEEYLPVLTEDGLTVQIVRKDNPEEIFYRLTSLYVYDSYQPEATGPVEEEPSREPVFVGPGTAEYAEEELPETMGPAPVKHYTEDNHYEVEALGDGKYRITSVVSADFLNSPDTVYPVTIDPSLGSTDSNSQDSYVWEAEPDGKYGSLNYIRFGKDNGGKIYGYHRFNQLPALPDKVNITDGWLKFTFRSGQTTGADGICRIVDSKQWYESNITWNTQPYGNWGFTSSHHNFQYYEFYMKPFLEMWVNGDYRNYGVMFTYNNMISDYNSVVSSEGEAHRAPTLTYTYTTALEIRDGGRYVGQLGQGGHHWYKFVPSVSGKYVFYTDGSTDTYGELYYGSQRLAVNNDGGEGSNFQLEYTLTAGLAYYIKVRGYNYTKTGAYGLSVKGKKAIIIVPGVMGTELVLGQAAQGFPAGTKVWPPNEQGSILEAPSKLALLQCDSEGVSIHDIRVRNDDNYGALDQYQTLFDELSNTYSSAARDVIFFAYDWRNPNAVSAAKLKTTVNQYINVSIVAHSMGGLVASHLVKDTGARDKITKVITLGTPFLGSLEMVPVMAHGELGAIDDALKDVPFPLNWVAKNKILQPELELISVNIPSLYELLPNEKFFTLDNRSYYSVNYPIGGNTSFTDFSSTRKYLAAAIEKYNPDLFDAAAERNNSLWIGNTHVTASVNSFYIIGEEYDTLRTYTCNYGTETYSTTSSSSGDGSVLSYSASMKDLYPDKTFFVTADHTGLVQYMGQKQTINGVVVDRPCIIQFVKNLIDGNMTLTSGIRSNPNRTI